MTRGVYLSLSLSLSLRLLNVRNKKKLIVIKIIIDFPQPATQRYHFWFSNIMSERNWNDELKKPEPRGKMMSDVVDGPDVIRTHDLPVISRAHHRAMLRAQKFA